VLLGRGSMFLDGEREIEHRLLPERLSAAGRRPPDGPGDRQPATVLRT
jgi:hypothetical protein